MAVADNIVPLNPFVDFWRRGFRRLVPIVPPGAPVSERSTLHKRLAVGDDARGKSPGVQHADGKWSGFQWLPYEADEQDLTRWHAMGAGVGVKTGLDPERGESLLLIDADTTDEALARVILDATRRHFGRLPVRIGRYPKAGYVVRTPGAFRYSRVVFGVAGGERIEILSDGKQFVASGVHPGTLRPYEWPDGLPNHDSVPVVSQDAIAAFLEDLRGRLPNASAVRQEGGGSAPVNQDGLKGPLDLVRSAVAATPNTSDLFPTRESYLDFGYAIKGALQDHPAEAFDIWAEWCERWTEPETGRVNERERMEADWRRMVPPYRSGFGLLMDTVGRVVPAARFDAGAAVAQMWFPDLPETDESPFAARQREEARANAPPGLTLVPLQAAAAAALSSSAPPLVKGLLDQGALSVVYGDSNVGKSFVVLDMALHIAMGAPYAGMRTTRLGVVYIAAEGGGGIRKRAAALLRRYPDATSAPFHLLMAPVDLFRPGADGDTGALIEAVRAVSAATPVGLIVVDTVARALAGGDENSPVDMGSFVRNLDKIRTATSAHVMGVHHTGKDAARGARGHSSLRAALDTEIEIGQGSIDVTKQRDLDKAWSTKFELVEVLLGQDADGDPVTSCTVRLVAAAAAPSAREGEILAAMRAIGGEAGAPEISAAIPGGAVNVDSCRFHLRSLENKGLVARVRRGLWRLTARGAARRSAAAPRPDEFFDVLD